MEGEAEEEFTRDAFLVRFDQEKRAISEAAAAAQPGSEEAVHRCLDELLTRVRALQLSFTNASALLPAYDVQRCSAALERLAQLLARRREELAPKKQFSFRRRAQVAMLPAHPTDDLLEPRPAPTAVIEPKAAAAAAPATAEAPLREEIGGTNALRLEGIQGALLSEAPEGRDVLLQGLEGCRVLLLGVVGALRCHGLRRCEVVVGAVSSSALLQDCQECIFTLATKQLRIHDCKRLLLMVRTLSKPALERSREVMLAPFDLAYEGSELHLAAAGLEKEEGEWAQVQDFDWHKRQASPHWCAVPAALRRPAPAAPEPERPVPELGALEAWQACWQAANEPAAAAGVPDEF